VVDSLPVLCFHKHSGFVPPESETCYTPNASETKFQTSVLNNCLKQPFLNNCFKHVFEFRIGTLHFRRLTSLPRDIGPVFTSICSFLRTKPVLSRSDFALFKM